MTARLQTAILGATGYAGLELTRLLLRHPRLKKPVLFQRAGSSSNGRDLADVFPALSGNGGYPLKEFSVGRLKDLGVDLLFLATPHELSRSLVPDVLAQGVRVVDLSGAWRLQQAKHREVYGFEDVDAALAAKTAAGAVYGLPELHRENVRDAALVANPGCYATSVILGLAPLVKAGLVDLSRGVISDSKSGVSGAGKEPTSKTHFVSVADNLSAYGVFGHRHLGEMVEQLGMSTEDLTFTPHLLPIPRGILSTIYVTLAKSMTTAEVEACYRRFYEGQRWVRVFAPPRLPEIQHSLHSNYCDIGFCLADDGRRLVVVACIDNLLKGAAGQAVQNLNVMCGWDEAEGLQ
jgi:N-acetyl-gamma-glutamyl-phosphate reductase